MWLLDHLCYRGTVDKISYQYAQKIFAIFYYFECKIELEIAIISMLSIFFGHYDPLWKFMFPIQANMKLNFSQLWNTYKTYIGIEMVIFFNVSSYTVLRRSKIMIKFLAVTKQCNKQSSKVNLYFCCLIIQLFWVI